MKPQPDIRPYILAELDYMLDRAGKLHAAHACALLILKLRILEGMKA